MKDIFQFEALSCQILGTDGFIGLGHFFAGLLVECAKFEKESQPYVLALLTRRCHVLFQIYLEYFEVLKARRKGISAGYSEEFFPELKGVTFNNIHAVKKHCVTDYNLLSLSSALTDYCRKNGDFPHLVIADELLIHGRTINHFLCDLQSRVERQLEDAMDRESIVWRFLDKLEIHVYTQNSDSLLLLSRYMKRLTAYQKCDRPIWRDISARLARLISVASINNVSYSWGIRVPMEVWQEQLIPLKKAPLRFQNCVTRLQEIQEDNYLFLYPDSRVLQTICTVRSRESQMPLLSDPRRSYARCRIFVPYLAFDHLTYKSVQNLHSRILADLDEFPDLQRLSRLLRRQGELADLPFQSQIELEDTYRWVQETNELVLEYLLFRKFAEDTFADAEQAMRCFAAYVDFEAIVRNYTQIRFDEDEERFSNEDEVLPALQELWSWVPGAGLLEDYLEILTAGSAPAWTERRAEFIRGGDLPPYAEIDELTERAVTNVIAEIGRGAERHAYHRLIQGVFISERSLAHWGDNYSLGDFITLCDGQIRRLVEAREPLRQEPNIYQVIALLVQAMELGILGMGPALEEGPLLAGEDTILPIHVEIYSMARAGEQALFLLPIRYREFIPVLQKIQIRCQDRERGNLDIRRFAREYCRHYPDFPKNEEELSAELITFQDQLEETGQTLEEWNIPLYDFPGVDYITPEGKKVKAVTRLLADLEKQMTNLDLYRHI